MPGSELLTAVSNASGGTLHIVLNPGSGKHAGDVKGEIESALASSGREFSIHEPSEGSEIDDLAREVVAIARSNGGVVVAAGGDGTINAVASATLGSGCAFGVLPLGTFNYFSRAHGIPSDIASACDILITARPQPIHVGQVNDRVFLVNGSIGIYPELLEEREQIKRRLGRSRFVAFVAALATLLRPHRKLRLEMELKGASRTLVTTTLFVGNNRLQLERVGVPQAARLERHRLVALAPKAVGFWGTLLVVLRALFGRLGDAPDVEILDFDRMTVRSRMGQRRFKVATDGEVEHLRSPLTFRVATHPLLLLRPEDPGDDPG
jgi:diacylglycerol kinase family enzyme